jgi:hypothetical protein
VEILADGRTKEEHNWFSKGLIKKFATVNVTIIAQPNRSPAIAQQTGEASPVFPVVCVSAFIRCRNVIEVERSDFFTEQIWYNRTLQN